MAKFPKLRLREFYSSNDPLIVDKMGPMRFPILEDAVKLGVGSFWTVSRYSYPQNDAQFRSLKALISGASFTQEVDDDPKQTVLHTPQSTEGPCNIFLANAAQGKITVVRSDFTLEDLGIEILQEYFEDDNGNHVPAVGKESKRMKAFTRPFRIAARRDQLRVLVLDPGDHPELLDGASLISDELVIDCVDNLRYPNNKYFNYSVVRNYMLDQRVFNGVLVGNLVDATTGENLNKFGKGQYIRANLPEGIDVITTPDNLKHEIRGHKWAWVGIEPQGPKAAREDQQTIANHWELCNPKSAQARLSDDAEKNIQRVFNGEFRQSTQSLSALSYSTDDAYNETSFANLMKWRVNAWIMHGGDYRSSPWLTRSIAELWLKSLGHGTQAWARTLKVPVHNGIRAQVVSHKLVDLYCQYEQDTTDISIERGQLRWFEPLKVAYVHDEDWSEIVIESHGGCDLDDFFLLRWVTDVETGSKKVIIHRSPNARGEYSVWHYVENDWHPEFVNSDGDKESFPNFDFSEMPVQILEALEQELTEYLALPSESDEKSRPIGQMPYLNTSCFKDIEQVMGLDGGYGQYELAVRARNSVDAFSFDRYAIYSETAVDAFAQAGSVEDQRFILEDRDRILEDLVKTLAEVDIYIQQRLGPTDVLSKELGPIASVKLVTDHVCQEYKKSVNIALSELEEPWYLADLGSNELYPKAVDLLKYSRSHMWRMNNIEGVRSEVHSDANLDTNKILVKYVEDIEDDYTRHLFMMAFWHACWTTPTSSGKITDQPLFGSDLFDHLTEALIYFGILHRPFVTGDGHIERMNMMHYIGDGMHSSNCRSCDEYIEFPTAALNKYWSSKGNCKQCTCTPVASSI